MHKNIIQFHAQRLVNMLTRKKCQTTALDIQKSRMKLFQVEPIPGTTGGYVRASRVQSNVVHIFNRQKLVEVAVFPSRVLCIFLFVEVIPYM